MKRKHAPLLWIVLVLLLVGGGGWMYYRRATAAVEVAAADVRMTPIECYVDERGRTTLPHVHRVTMPQRGRVLPITLQEGDRVEQGQVVARLDDADLQDALTEAEAIVAAMTATVRATRAQRQASEARRDFLQWLSGVRKKLHKRNALSEQIYRETRAGYLQSARETEGDAALSHAFEALASAGKLLPIFIGRYLDRTTVESPTAGVVLRRYVKNTKVLQPGAPLLDIGNLDSLEVTVPVLTGEAVSIASGDPVEIYGDTVGEHAVTGSVKRVEPRGYTKVSSLGVEQQRVDVIVAFAQGELDRLRERAGGRLGVAYRVHARIITDRREQALTVPRTALFRGDGGWRVYAIEEGRAVLRTVEVGMENRERVEITGGLASGDRVILAPDAAITEGVRVAAEGEK